MTFIPLVFFLLHIWSTVRLIVYFSKNYRLLANTTLLVLEVSSVTLYVHSAVKSSVVCNRELVTVVKGLLMESSFACLPQMFDKELLLSSVVSGSVRKLTRN